LDASNISAIEDIALYELDSLYRSYNGEYKKEIDSIFEPIKNKSISSIELDILMDIEEAMLNKFPQYREKTFTTELNFDDPIERLLAQLKVAIVSKGGFELANDFQNLSMFSFSFADFGDLITSLFTENKKEYTRTGKRIEGLLGGMI
jgi:hypothetical protein